MNKYLYILLLVLLQGSCAVFAQDTLIFTGQMSGWANYNTGSDLPIWMGGRYLPQLNYQINLSENKMIDFEASANIYGSIGIHPFDSGFTDRSIKPYRAWVRYSTNQLELRAGLQKINFGSAAMLRPLMWFDQIDPRDPLQLTDGIWGLLGRYYFLNNTNLWIWALHGNEEPKTWETTKTSQKFPELGGRFQMPVSSGEAAISYHFRKADTEGLEDAGTTTEMSENRIGLDGKWDVEVGIWFEAVWINKSENLGIFTNQEMANVGMDYTFGIGNGLNVIMEQLFVSYDEKAFALSNAISFTGLSASYPTGLFSNLNAIIYYDWTHSASYNFANWKKQIKNLSLHLMAYWNPKEYRIPLQENAGDIFSGRGIQVMLVWNH